MADVLRWEYLRLSMYYGQGNPGNASASNVVTRPFIYNDIVYGTQQNPMHKIVYDGRTLNNYRYTYPIADARVDRSSGRLIGVLSSGFSLHNCSAHVYKNRKIAGKYCLATSLSGKLPANCTFPLSVTIEETHYDVCTTGYAVGRTATEDDLVKITFETFDGTKKLVIGTDNEDVFVYDLPESQQYLELDFGNTPQNIPDKFYDWIVVNGSYTPPDTDQIQFVDAELLDRNITRIADAVRTKGGTRARLIFPDGIIDAVNEISVGITPIGELQVTENGNYDITDKETVDVNVQPELQDKVVTENGGDISADEGYYGLSKVTVNIPVYEGQVGLT